MNAKTCTFKCKNEGISEQKDIGLPIFNGIDRSDEDVITMVTHLAEAADAQNAAAHSQNILRFSKKKRSASAC